MRHIRRIAVHTAVGITLLAAGTQGAQAATVVITSVVSDVNRTSLFINGQNFCTTPVPEILIFLPPGPAAVSLPVTSFSVTRITVGYPAGAAGVYLFAVKCGPLAANYTYYAAVLDPENGATLGANTFTGVQTAPAFVGDGAGLTNLPIPGGVATLGANTFSGSQSITGALDVTGDVVVDGNLGAQGSGNVAGDFGIGRPVPRAKLDVAGDAAQDRSANGFVKATGLFTISQNAQGQVSISIVRCYNGVLNTSTGNCGFTPQVLQIPGGFKVNVNFGFTVNDRFVSYTDLAIAGNDVFNANVGTIAFLDPTTVRVITKGASFFIMVF